MSGTADTVFLRAFSWLQTSVTALEADLQASGPPQLVTPLIDALRTRLGLELNKSAALVDPNGFNASHAQAQSLAVATMVVGESLAALKTIGELLAAIGGGNAGLSDLSNVIKQIKRIVSSDPGKPPSAYSIAKLLLILSGDADAPVGDAAIFGVALNPDPFALEPVAGEQRRAGTAEGRA